MKSIDDTKHIETSFNLLKITDQQEDEFIENYTKQIPDMLLYGKISAMDVIDYDEFMNKHKEKHKIQELLDILDKKISSIARIIPLFITKELGKAKNKKAMCDKLKIYLLNQRREVLIHSTIKQQSVPIEKQESGLWKQYKAWFIFIICASIIIAITVVLYLVNTIINVILYIRLKKRQKTLPLWYIFATLYGTYYLLL